MDDVSKRMILMLCDVRSVHNVGTMLRTADAVGVEEVILCGYTPAPIDRFGRERADIHKTALGAELSVRWRQTDNALLALETLRDAGYSIVVLEQTDTAIPYTSYVPEGNVVLVVGNEILGVPHEVCTRADVCIEIPMSGTKESLNVAVATGVALFHLRDTTPAISR